MRLLVHDAREWRVAMKTSSSGKLATDLGVDWVC